MADTDDLPDWIIIARTLDGEAGNQGYAGMQGVGCTIQRRVSLCWQGEKTARGVCLHREQYDCWMPGDDRNRIMAVDYETPQTALVIADQILKQILSDITNKATHYFDDSIEPPDWASPDKFTVKIGRLSFYNLSS